MRSETYLFSVNGKPMLAPDASVSVSYSDIDGADAGRDQNGVLHRSVVRYKVASWEFTYSNLTDEESAIWKTCSPTRLPSNSVTPAGRMPPPMKPPSATAPSTASHGKMPGQACGRS